VTVIIIVSLLAAGWCALAVARDRFIDLSHLVALVVVQVAVLVQAVLALVRMGGGARPVELATFVGYLATAVLVMPLAVMLSFMERTRWGSVIVAVAALVVAILTVRLQQVWTPLR
jgi:hypothetical protein